jgi:hypothetical protein
MNPDIFTLILVTIIVIIISGILSKDDNNRYS